MVEDQQYIYQTNGKPSEHGCFIENRPKWGLLRGKTMTATLF
ncbi:hypothetical protein FORC065_3294 [Yersinia enterocolitica]|nr:hypothetical protein FORC065_3294 [Yersinia enterocolitica]